MLCVLILTSVTLQSFLCEWVKLLQFLHQNKVSVEHNWLFVSDFDFLLLMDVIVGEEWLCTDLHSGACLVVSVWLIWSLHLVCWVINCNSGKPPGKDQEHFVVTKVSFPSHGSSCHPSCAVQDCLLWACVDISIYLSLCTDKIWIALVEQWQESFSPQTFAMANLLCLRAILPSEAVTSGPPQALPVPGGVTWWAGVWAHWLREAHCASAVILPLPW